jgi:ribosome-binding protein aMBF1 (putative translation factor)
MNRVREYRQKLGLRQYELASLIRKPQTVLCWIERGRVNPSKEEREVLARVLRVSEHKLFR